MIIWLYFYRSTESPLFWRYIKILIEEIRFLGFALKQSKSSAEDNGDWKCTDDPGSTMRYLIVEAGWWGHRNLCTFVNVLSFS